MTRSVFVEFCSLVSLVPLFWVWEVPYIVRIVLYRLLAQLSPFMFVIQNFSTSLKICRELVNVSVVY